MSEPVIYNFVDDVPRKKPENREGLADHLGGHENETHVDEGTLNYFIEKFSYNI